MAEEQLRRGKGNVERLARFLRLFEEFSLLSGRVSALCAQLAQEAWALYGAKGAASEPLRSLLGALAAPPAALPAAPPRYQLELEQREEELGRLGAELLRLQRRGAHYEAKLRLLRERKANPTRLSRNGIKLHAAQALAQQAADAAAAAVLRHDQDKLCVLRPLLAGLLAAVDAGAARVGRLAPHTDQALRALRGKEGARYHADFLAEPAAPLPLLQLSPRRERVDKGVDATPHLALPPAGAPATAPLATPLSDHFFYPRAAPPSPFGHVDLSFRSSARSFANHT